MRDYKPIRGSFILGRRDGSIRDTRTFQNSHICPQTHFAYLQKPAFHELFIRILLFHEFFIRMCCIFNDFMNTKQNRGAILSRMVRISGRDLYSRPQL